MWNEKMDDIDLDNAVDGLGMVGGVIEDLEFERIALMELAEDEEFRRREVEVGPGLERSLNACDHLDSWVGWGRVGGGKR